jgi:AraC-like DNA-binding protein
MSGSAAERATIHDEWLRFIGQHVCTYKLSRALPRDPSFQIDARSRSADGFSISRFRTLGGKAQLVREAPEIAADNRDHYIVYAPLSGNLELAHLRRTQLCQPATFVLLVSSDTIVHTKLGNNDTISFVMPRGFVDQRLVNGEGRCMQPKDCQSGLGHLAFHALQDFQKDSETMSDGEFESASGLIGELVLLALSGCNDSTIAPRTVRTASLSRAKRVIRARLCDPDLTLMHVANECRISLGHLHHLFQDEGCTAWQFLKHQRLERARQLLQRPSRPDVTVTEVSLASGFSNMSQFSTAFRRAFSVSPSDLLRGAAKSR